MAKSIRNRNIRTAEPIADSGNREAFESARAAIIRVNRDIAAGNDVADKTLQFVREMAGIYRLHLVSDGVRTVTAPERDPELAGLIKLYFGIPSVDKIDLDAMIDAEKERIKQEESK